MTFNLYDEVHDLRPMSGENTAWVGVKHPGHPANRFGVIICEVCAVSRTGWDKVKEYEFVDCGGETI